MAAAGFLVTLAIFLVSSSSFSYAFDDDPLQDFCVAVPDASAGGKSFPNNNSEHVLFGGIFT